MNALMEAEGEPEGFIIASISHKQIDIVRAAIDKEKELRKHKTKELFTERCGI